MKGGEVDLEGMEKREEGKGEVFILGGMRGGVVCR